MIHIPIRVRNAVINFYVFIDVPDPSIKINSFVRYFERMPDEHLNVVYPIFVIERNPNGGSGGGTIMPSRVANFKSPRRARLTLVPDDMVDSLVIDRGLGLISIPRNRWERPVGRLVSTVLHEVGHSVDYELGLRPSAPITIQDVIGVRPTCGGGASGSILRHMVEAYARYVINPRTICRDPGSTHQQAINALRSTRAFRQMTNGTL